jgi:hypothetical protein
MTTAPVVGAAPGRVAEKQSSRERTDADERTHDNAAGPRNSPIAGTPVGTKESDSCLYSAHAGAPTARARWSSGEPELWQLGCHQLTR